MTVKELVKILGAFRDDAQVVVISKSSEPSPAPEDAPSPVRPVALVLPYLRGDDYPAMVSLVTQRDL